jgi:KaiC/GvpD/RAD55 family RecA-like ATPase
MGSSEIVEIIGRANSGKSYFCFAFILHCIKKDLTVIFIDSNENYEMLLEFIKKRIG